MLLREFYQELMEAMREVGFTPDDNDHLHAVVAAVLHLGNITYAAAGTHDPASISSPKAVTKTVADLLKLPIDKLESALLITETLTRGETIKKPYTADQAYGNVPPHPRYYFMLLDCRDATAGRADRVDQSDFAPGGAGQHGSAECGRWAGRAG